MTPDQITEEALHNADLADRLVGWLCFYIGVGLVTAIVAGWA